MDYTARIELNTEPAEDLIDQLMTELAHFEPSVGTSPHGWAEMLMTIPADSIAQAANIADALVSRHTTAALVSLEILTTEEFERRQGFDRVPELIGVADAAEMLGVSPQRVRQMIDEHKLSAHRFGERGLVLLRKEVQAKASVISVS